MAAIVFKQDHKLNGQKLYSHLVKTLPAYAWPWFLRIQVLQVERRYSSRSICILKYDRFSLISSLCFQISLDVTETFKQQKVKLVKEGFNPEVTQDPLYFLDISQKGYILLTVSLYQDIVSGKINL